MAYGLNFKGSHGYTQIDQSYTNFVLVKSDTFTTNLVGSSYNQYPAEGGAYQSYQTTVQNIDTGLPFDASYCTALRTTGSNPVMLLRTDNVNGQYRIVVAARSGVQSGEYYVYGPPSKAPSPSGNWGVQLFDGSGTGQSNVRYDSRYKYMKITGEVTRNWRAGAQERLHGTFSGKMAFMTAQQALQWIQMPSAAQQPGSYTLEACGGYISSGGQYDNQFWSKPFAIAQGSAGGTTPGGQPLYSNYPESARFYMLDVS